jgi:Rrf2 family nitric oxide-sensitive transcriptional repressor
MQLSLQTDYALRTLMALTASDDQLTVDWIATHYGISRNHLAKVAQKLQADGYVITIRGRNGGMRLAKPADQINVGDVVRRVENLTAFVGCMDGGVGCKIDGACGLKPALSGAIALFLEHLDGFSVADITGKTDAMMMRLQVAD